MGYPTVASDALTRLASNTASRNGVVEQPIRPNVRIYDIAGASHARVSKADCKLAPARLDWTPVSRATLLRLDRWVADHVEPPSTRLMPLERSNEANVLPVPARLQAVI